MAFDIFLKMEDIEGEATSEKHKGEIEVLSWSWGVSNQTSQGGGGGGGVGRSFSFTKKIDKATPLLLGAACTGRHFDKVHITTRRVRVDQKTGAGHDFYKVTLSDCLISNMNGDGEDSSVPMDSFSINFAKVEMHYQTQDRQSFEGECTFT